MSDRPWTIPRLAGWFDWKYEGKIENPLKKSKSRHQLADRMMPELKTSYLITQSVEKAINESKGTG